MAGEPAEPTELEGGIEEDQTDAKPDRQGRFLLFGQ